MKLPKAKLYLKALAASIRTSRKTLKSLQRGDKIESVVPSWKLQSSVLPSLTFQFRHRHIAYCLLKGRPYEIIESKVLPGNEPNWDIIESLKEEILKEESEVPLATTGS